MKKYFEIIIALLVGIGVIFNTTNVHAMSAKNMSNKVYKVSVSTSYDENNPIVQSAEQDDQDMGDEYYYLFTGSKGKCLTLRADDNKRKINKMLSNKKYAMKQIKKSGLEYSVNDGRLDINDENSNFNDKDRIVFVADDCDPLVEDGTGNFSFHENPSRGLSHLGITGVDYNFVLSPQQYNFK
ncbi:hypothetical protein [Limosilactobacillus pontis]|uniref:hypothetical protein n=1 Tax=Limosilactobacillus pontis TaxID=35787 RepID=UPI002F267DCB